MCNRLPEINKNGDAGIFPVYYSLKLRKNQNVFRQDAAKLMQKTVIKHCQPAGVMPQNVQAYISGQSGSI